jgi:hypothetical protein
MKAICPISGVPFRTYDSLPISMAVKHPIFTVPYEALVSLLEDIRQQEQDQILNLTPELMAQKDAVNEISKIKTMTEAIHAAIHEKNWRNPAFRLYQTKHLVMLALMSHAGLIENEPGFVARPAPQIIEAFFWQATELFIWANCIRSPTLMELVPHYKVTKGNEDLNNFKEYLEILDGVKNKLGARYRSISEENKLQVWEKAIAILAKRRNVLKQEITSSTNPIAAKWALTITRAPKDMWDFWYQILSSRSLSITFDGVKVDDKWEPVTGGDLRELRDYLEDNLIGPKGEDKEPHRDDSEYYFIARQTVLSIVRRHITILEQGTTSYQIVNQAVGDDILNASDDVLEQKAIDAGLPHRPNITGKTKIEVIRAMAAWRHETKSALLKLAEPSIEEDSKKILAQQPLIKVGGKYEIL